MLIAVMAALPEERDDRAAARAATGAQGAFGGELGKETTFGAYLGAPYHYPSDFTFKKEPGTDFTMKKVEWYTHPFENPLYYGARIQRWSANGRTGAMLDFVHSKAYSPMDQVPKIEGTIDGKPAPDTAKIRDLFTKLEFTHGHNMLTLNGLMRFGTFSNVIVPYAGWVRAFRCRTPKCS